MKATAVIRSIALSCLFAAMASGQPAGDQDRDGLSDDPEQAPLVRFVPTFMVSATAKASAIGAEEHGPVVWISGGKHASFLTRDLCGRGCGEDRCEQMAELTIRKIVNIGELGAPANGAVWTASNLWPLAPKMGTDFNPRVMAQLDAAGADAVISAYAMPPGVQPVVRAGGTTVNALDMSNRRKDEALDMASGKVDRSLRRANRSVREWFRRVTN